MELGLVARQLLKLENWSVIVVHVSACTMSHCLSVSPLPPSLFACESFVSGEIACVPPLKLSILCPRVIFGEVVAFR